VGSQAKHSFDLRSFSALQGQIASLEITPRFPMAKCFGSNQYRRRDNHLPILDIFDRLSRNILPDQSWHS